MYVYYFYVKGVETTSLLSKANRTESFEKIESELF